MPPDVRPLTPAHHKPNKPQQAHPKEEEDIITFTMDNEEIPQDAGNGGGDGGESSKPKEESKPGEWNYDCNNLWIGSTCF